MSKLAIWRHDRQLSLEAAGALVGVSGVAWSRYERGQRVPRPEIVSRIYDVTDGHIGPPDFYHLTNEQAA